MGELIARREPLLPTRWLSVTSENRILLVFWLLGLLNNSGEQTC